MVDLLEHLVEKTFVNYLSDLELTDILKSAIRGIEPNQFILKEWNEAVRYLCKTDATFDSAENAKEYLLNYKPNLRYEYK